MHLNKYTFDQRKRMDLRVMLKLVHLVPTNKGSHITRVISNIMLLNGHLNSLGRLFINWVTFNNFGLKS